MTKKKNFWDKISLDNLSSQSMAEILFDMYINAPSVAVKIIQQIANLHFGKHLAVDGGMGTKTIEALNSISPVELFNHYKLGRQHYYNYRAAATSFVPQIWIDFFSSMRIKSDAKYREFLKGWLNRTKHFTIEAAEAVKKNPS